MGKTFWEFCSLKTRGYFDKYVLNRKIVRNKAFRIQFLDLTLIYRNIQASLNCKKAHIFLPDKKKKKNNKKKKNKINKKKKIISSQGGWSPSYPG